MSDPRHTYSAGAIRDLMAAVCAQREEGRVVSQQDEVIRLHSTREGDAYVVRDQHGRRLGNVVSIAIKADAQDVTLLTVTLLDASVVDGRPHRNLTRAAG